MSISEIGGYLEQGSSGGIRSVQEILDNLPDVEKYRHSDQCGVIESHYWWFPSGDFIHLFRENDHITLDRLTMGSVREHNRTRIYELYFSHTDGHTYLDTRFIPSQSEEFSYYEKEPITKRQALNWFRDGQRIKDVEIDYEARPIPGSPSLYLLLDQELKQDPEVYRAAWQSILWELAYEYWSCDRDIPVLLSNRDMEDIIADFSGRATAAALHEHLPSDSSLAWEALTELSYLHQQKMIAQYIHDAEHGDQRKRESELYPVCVRFAKEHDFERLGRNLGWELEKDPPRSYPLR